MPTFLEVLGFVCYPPGLMTGPQISFLKYKRFTAGEFDEYMSTRWPYALARLLLGVGVIVSYPLLRPLVPSEYLLSDEYEVGSAAHMSNTMMAGISDPECSRYFNSLIQKSNYAMKMAFLAAWGQVTLTKYLGVWLVAVSWLIILP